MLTNIYFTRHAHSTYTADELGRPLSERGMADAKRVTELLKKETISHVLSSPYRRAIQTVEGVAAYFRLEIEIDTNLRERMLAGEPVEDFEKAITKVWQNDHFSWEGGESNATAQQRGVAAISYVLEKYAGQNIVIGTHGNIMVLIMQHFHNQYGFEFWQKLAMPDIYKITFDEKSLVAVDRIWSDDDE